MNKDQLVRDAAQESGLSISQTKQALEAILKSIENELGRGDPVQLIGFGTFEVRHRGARTGRNPKTGDEIQISASNNVGFKAGSALKARVNQ